MHIEAQPTTVFVIRLTLGEALAVLTDPAPFQRELRAQLPPRGETVAPARSNHRAVRVGATHRVARPKASQGKQVACPECGKLLLPGSLWAHKKKQHAAPAAA